MKTGDNWIGRIVLTWEACKTCAHYRRDPPHEWCALGDATDLHQIDGDHVACGAYEAREEVDTAKDRV